MKATRLGILLFALAAIAGPLYTVPEYSPFSNLISELGAQGTPRSWIMSVGFLALGAGIVAGGGVGFSRPLLPFMAFGVFMALAGLLGHKPVDPEVPYVPWVHAAHSALATAAGVSITAGLAWQAVRQRETLPRVTAAALAVLCLALPLSMLALPDAQGAIQRVMYLLIFSWLWVNYPERVSTRRSAPAGPLGH